MLYKTIFLLIVMHLISNIIKTLTILRVILLMAGVERIELPTVVLENFFETL